MIRLLYKHVIYLIDLVKNDLNELGDGETLNKKEYKIFKEHKILVEDILIILRRSKENIEGFRRERGDNE